MFHGTRRLGHLAPWEGLDMSENTNYIGPYELRGELGRGAMARVWLAWDPNLAREVAIKVPTFDTRLSSEALQEMGRRFVAEGRTAARLSHPGIVTIYAADVWDGTPAIVMERVQGVTLSALLQGGALAPAEVLSILDQLLDAVGYAHASGIVHRDIKPDNIFVTPDGSVKLADFGIAHVDGSAITMGTVAGAVLGTPGYMSPEQARGAQVDARTDLFSIAVVAHEMLTGHNPFGAGEGADATTLIYRIVHEPVPELPLEASAGLPNDLRPAIMAALSKDPDQRPSSAAAFKAMLHGEPVVSQVRSAAGGWDQWPAAGSGSMSQDATATGTSVRQSAGIAGTALDRRSGNSWLPYVLVGAACVTALVVALLSATSGGGGGSATGVVDQPVSSEATEPATPPSDDTDQVTILTPSTAGPDDYLIPDSDTHWYTEDEANALSNEQLYFGRNEILARHHKGFNDPRLTSYFESKSWYTMKYTPDEWMERYGDYTTPCNDTERHNWDTFLLIENDRNSPFLGDFQ